jgi:hypothetical protein
MGLLVYVLCGQCVGSNKASALTQIPILCVTFPAQLGCGCPSDGHCSANPKRSAPEQF